MSTYLLNATQRFKELASVLNGKLFVSIVVYADESGTHDPKGQETGSQVVTIAGYIAWEDDWVRFCDDWIAVLKREGIPYFHMKDFVDKRNRQNDPTWMYYGWTEERRHKFLYDLAPIAKGKTICGVGNIVSTKHYDKLIPPDGKRLLSQPYILCLIGFLSEILAQAKNRLMDHPAEKLTFLFDVNDENAGQAVELFSRIRKEADPDSRMGAIAFVDDKEHIPVQAADLLAYRVRQQLTRLVGHERTEVKELDRALGLTKQGQKPAHVSLCGHDEVYLRRMVDRIKREQRPWDWDGKPKV